MPLILGTNSIKDEGYVVDNSLRFDDDSSDYLNRTPSSSGNRKTWTYSAWVKLSGLGTQRSILSAGNTTYYTDLRIDSNDKITFFIDDSLSYSVTTSQVLRDISAWYHVVVAFDTTQATASDRVKIYLNGSQITGFSSTSYPALNYDGRINSTDEHSVGRRNASNNHFFDGYMAEVVFVNGSQLDPTSFGEFDSDSPTIWKPIDVSGLTFGTNGFYLDFENSGSLGADVSGNGNNFTVNNLTSVDQSTDTCTNNFATWNPLEDYYFQANYFKDGNLHVRTDGSNFTYLPATFGVSSGKWYWEVEYDAQQVDSYSLIGITSTQSTATTQELGHHSNDWGYYSNSGQYINSDSRTGYGNSYAVGDIIGVALDLDNNKLYFSKNGTFQNSGDPTSGATGTGAISITAPSSTPLGNYFPAICFFDATGKGTFKANFGSPMESISSGNSDANGYGNFEYSVPSGYYSLNSKNLAEFG
jgi:hypothetical protein